MKKIGIIVPHYNSVQSTIRLLDSIYSSIGEKLDVETIVVDDRSTDDISKLKEKIESLKFVRLLYNNSLNKGAGACRNIGMKNLECDWLIFADADDYFETGFEDKILKYINSDSDIIYFDCTSRDEETGEESNRHIFLNEILDRYRKDSSIKNENYLKFNWIVPWGKMIRSSIITDTSIEFDELLVSNDVMFSIKLGCLLKKIDVSQDVLYCVTKSSGSLTTTMSAENYKTRTQVIIEKNVFLREQLSKEEYKYLGNYFGRWLIDGYILYNLDFRDLVNYFILFKKNRIPFFPPLSTIQKVGQFVKGTVLERKYRKFT